MDDVCVGMGAVGGGRDVFLFLFLDRYVTVFDLHEKCEPQVMISVGHLGRVRTLYLVNLN